MTIERIVELEKFIEREMKGNEAFPNNAGCVARAKIDRDILAYLKELKEYRKSWKRLEEEMNKLDPDYDSYSVKNNACLLVDICRPKEGDIK